MSTPPRDYHSPFQTETPPTLFHASSIPSFGLGIVNYEFPTPPTEDLTTPPPSVGFSNEQDWFFDFQMDEDHLYRPTQSQRLPSSPTPTVVNYTFRQKTTFPTSTSLTAAADLPSLVSTSNLEQNEDQTEDFHRLLYNLTPLPSNATTPMDFPISAPRQEANEDWYGQQLELPESIPQLQFPRPLSTTIKSETRWSPFPSDGTIPPFALLTSSQQLSAPQSDGVTTHTLLSHATVNSDSKRARSSSWPGVEDSQGQPRRRSSVATQNEDRNRKFQCFCCHFRFERKSNCEAHEKTHYPLHCRHRLACPNCSKTFNRNTDLERHVNAVS